MSISTYSSSNGKATVQRERAGSVSSMGSADSAGSEPTKDNTGTPDSDSDSEDEIMALLRPLTPSPHLVDRSGPTENDVAISRGRANHNAVFVPFLTDADVPAIPGQPGQPGGPGPQDLDQN